MDAGRFQPHRDAPMETMPVATGADAGMVNLLKALALFRRATQAVAVCLGNARHTIAVPADAQVTSSSIRVKEAVLQKPAMAAPGEAANNTNVPGTF